MAFHRKKLLLCGLGLAALLIPPVRETTLPFVCALLLAGCLQRPMDFLARRHIPRAVSAFLFLAVFLIPLCLMLIYGIQMLLRSASVLLQQLTPVFQNGLGLDNLLYRWLTALPPEMQDRLRAMLEALQAQKGELVSALVSGLGEWSSAWLSALPGHFAVSALFLLAFFFCAVGFNEIRALLLRVLPQDWCRALGRLQRTLYHHLTQWCRAEGKLVGLIFCELALGFLLLRVRGWLFLALAVTLIDLVPLVGSGLILLPWAGVSWFLSNRSQCVALIVIWICVWLTRTILEPKLVGRHLELPTALSLFAAVLGAKLWGIKGLILLPVLSAALLTFFQNDGQKAGAELAEPEPKPCSYEKRNRSPKVEPGTRMGTPKR